MTLAQEFGALSPEGQHFASMTGAQPKGIGKRPRECGNAPLDNRCSTPGKCQKVSSDIARPADEHGGPPEEHAQVLMLWLIEEGCPPDVEEEPSSSDDSEPHAPRNPDASAGAEASSADLVGK